MYSVRRFSQDYTILLFDKFKIHILIQYFFWKLLQINNHNTDFIPVLFLLRNIFDYIILDFFYFLEKFDIHSFIKFTLDIQIFKIVVQIVMILSGEAS